MDLVEHILLLLISFVANAFSAFAGGGAGLIQLPVLIFLGLPFGIALATHKVASVALGIGATLRHLREGNTEWQFVLYVLVAGVPGVILGTQIILAVSERAAEVALGILTAAIGVYSWIKPDLGQASQLRNRDLRGFVIGGAGLFAIGVLNGSLTSGTGLFATLWLIRWFGLDYKAAVAYTLVTVGVFWNGTGALALGWAGQIQWSWLPALIVGSLLGGYVGAHWGIVKGNRAIKRAFEIITLVIGTKLIVG